MSSESNSIFTRKKVWLNLEDVVAAINYCRRMQPFSHRLPSSRVIGIYAYISCEQSTNHVKK